MDKMTDTRDLPIWAQNLIREAHKEAHKVYRKQRLMYLKYRDDPIGFGEEILGDVYTEDVKRMMRSVVDNTITIARSANAVGKTFASAKIALWFYLTFPDSKVFVTAAPPEDNLRNLLWGEILHAVHKQPEIVGDDRVTDLRIERHKQSYIAGLTIPTTGTKEQRETKFSGKHSPYLLFIVDEGDAVPEEVYRGIDSCMSGGHIRLLVLFNPRAKYGPVYEMEATKRANVVTLSAIDHPNVISGDDIIPGAVSRETVVRRINKWTRPAVEGETPDETKRFVVPDFLVGAVATAEDGTPFPPLQAGVRVIMENSFSYMVMGQYPAQADTQLISQDWINAATQRWLDYVAEYGEMPPVASARLGLDVAEYGVDFNVPILRYENFVARPERIWQGVDPFETAEKAIVICKEKKPSMLLVDGTGVGSGIAPYVARQRRNIGLTSMGCYSVKFSNKPSPVIKTEEGDFFQLRDQLWWACREWLRTKDAMLPPHPLLTQELSVPTYEVRNGKIYVMQKKDMKEILKRSPNFADALVLTFMPAERARVIPGSE